MINLRLPLLATALATAVTAQDPPCWYPNLGASLGLMDEDISLGQALGFAFTYNGVGYTDIQVCDNGYITLGASGGAVDFDPYSVTLVSDPFARICPLWMDLDPDSGGDIFFNAVPAAGGVPAHAIITWLDVPEYGGPTLHTFQLVLIDGGQVRCHYGANLAASNVPWLIGASPGNGAATNAVTFAALPLLTNGNATFHEESLTGAPSLVDAAVQWLPDGTGGYTILGATGCAETSSYGSGCVESYTSFYEWFASTQSVDLSNTSFMLLFTGVGYLGMPSTTTFTPPGAGAVSLGLIDDSEVTQALASALAYPGGTTSSLNICSNGHISVASNGASGDYSPSVGEFLNWANTTWAVWRDFAPDSTNPTANGDVLFEETGNLSIVTWLNVLGWDGFSWGVTPSSFQIVFDRSTGNVEFVFGQLDTVSASGYGDGWVVGFTRAGPSLDPGNIDLTTAIPAGSIVLEDVDQAPLQLMPASLPFASSTVGLEVSGISPTAPLGGVLVGLQKLSPGIDLTPYGMPGCYQYTQVLGAILFFPAGAATYTVPFSVPSLIGLPIQVQAALYDAQAGFNPLGAISSNGIELKVGT